MQSILGISLYIPAVQIGLEQILKRADTNILKSARFWSARRNSFKLIGKSLSVLCGRDVSRIFRTCLQEFRDWRGANFEQLFECMQEIGKA